MRAAHAPVQSARASARRAKDSREKSGWRGIKPKPAGKEAVVKKSVRRRAAAYGGVPSMRGALVLCLTLAILAVTVSYLTSEEPKHQGLRRLNERTWYFPTSFRSFGVTKVNGNMLLLKVDSSARSGKVLVAVNCVKPTPELLADVRLLEQSQGAKLAYIVLGSDWHHLHSREWAEAFGIPVHFSSQRPVRHHQAEAFGKVILDAQAPRIEGLDEIKLIPWLGFAGPFWATALDEAERREVSVFYDGTLFIFDLLLPMASQLPDFLQGGRLQSSIDAVFGREPMFWYNSVGFRLLDAKQAKASTEALLRLPVQRLVFAHGDVERGLIVEGADKATAVLRHHLAHFL